MNKKKDKRKAIRRKIIDEFNLFITVPTWGNQVIHISDISKTGIGIQKLSVHRSYVQFSKKLVSFYFHINLNLKIPLKFKIIRIDETTIGCLIHKKPTKNYHAYKAFFELLNLLVNL